jgi:hypothetical protein
VLEQVYQKFRVNHHTVFPKAPPYLMVMVVVIA